MQTALTRFRHRLADIDALPQLTLLGILVGCAAGVLIIVFRYIIEVSLNLILAGNSEGFEQLSPFWRFILPVCGAIVIATGMHFLRERDRHVSMGHVLERLHNFQGRMPASNLIVQFVGGAISLISGQSVGREGPAIHMGASAGSLIGQKLKLPHNSLRTLLGCGVAAAIAASFDTPVAGVIFAMEVVLMGYSITGFIPIMMATVCGTLIARATFGGEVFLRVGDAALYGLELQGLWEIPFMMLAGLIIALFATLYMRLQLSFNRLAHYPIFWRLLAAGLLTGTIGVIFPEILGLGYDTIHLSLEGQLSFTLLLGLALAKILATSFSISMGMPAGLIGPQLFIGACLGGMIGIVGQALFPESVNHMGIYVLLGMAAMMGAVLNAPLAALMAVMELTYAPGVMFPSMLIIVVACVITRQLCQCDGIFIEQLKHNGTTLESGPIQQLLGNIGVRSAMQTAFVETTHRLTLDAAKALLCNNPLWLVTHNEQGELLLRASDLALAIQGAENPGAVQNSKAVVIDLLEIPAERFHLQPIPELSNLFEAKQILDKCPDSALFVTPQIQTTSQAKVIGIVTQDTINNYYY